MNGGRFHDMKTHCGKNMLREVLKDYRVIIAIITDMARGLRVLVNFGWVGFGM